jgi:hypothetical protein
MKIKQWLHDNWAMMVLAAVMLFCLPWGLTEGGWLSSNTVLWLATIGGTVTGLLLACVVRRSTVLAGLVLISGVLFVVQAESHALPPIRPALGEIVSLVNWVNFELEKTVYQVIVEPETESLPVLPPPDLPEWRAAQERLLLYVWNLQRDWPPRLVPKQWSRGQTLLGSLLGFLIWIIVIPSLWLLVRRRPIWPALLLVTGVLALSIYYAGTGWTYLVLGLSAGLMLAGSSTQREIESRWNPELLPYWLDLERWLSSGGIAVGVALMMVLTIKLTDPDFQRQIRDILNPPEKAAGAAQRSSTYSANGMRLGVWPREHLLGGSADLLKLPVMSIATPGIAPARFYWQASSYSQYTGHGWRTKMSSTVADQVEPLWPKSPEPPPGFSLLRQSFRFESPTEQVYAAGRPVRLSQAGEGIWSDRQHMDLVTVNMVTAQSAYEVLSWVPSTAPDDLRSAPEEYPDWATEIYLPLPDELPARVKTLAEEISAEATNPYDRALAIQNYLRANYPYTLDLDEPPGDRDVVDYFLFDLKKGYCDYYASAMVVMARSIGLPARLAVGYATGAYDAESQSYHVTMAEAHSWVEIYFPDFGWIAFEPTASRPAIEHGAISSWTEQTAETSQQSIAAFEKESASPYFGLKEGLLLLAVIVVILILLAGSVILVVFIGTPGRRRDEPERAIASLYRDLLAGGRRLGMTPSPTQTPHEFLLALRLELSKRARRGPRRMGDWDVRLEQTSGVAARLISLYEDMCYSPRQLDQLHVNKVLDAWPHLRRGLWLFWLLGSRHSEREEIA